MVVGHATFAQEVILTSHISNNVLEIVQQKQIIYVVIETKPFKETGNNQT